MIVYTATKNEFISDVINNNIENRILDSFVREIGYSTTKSEIESWRNSMLYMNNIVSDPEIPNDAGIAIEYKIPQTSKRIDFIITGEGSDNKDVAVLIELKQWSTAEPTDMDGVVKTFVGGRVREVSHPSYQVWSYAALLEDFNSSVQEDGINIKSCAYLHNYEPDNVITSSFYSEYTDKAPVFLRPDAQKLRDFIKKYVKYGDKKDILYRIDNGKIKPSKQLADSLGSMLEGNKDFTLIDDQKIVYETALKLASQSTENNKNVLIVKGGPGTGKTVVAINLLVELTRMGQVAQYVTRNSAPRKVYEAKLTGKFTKSRISNLFTSSGSFTNSEPNTFDSLIVDEAHRLNKKSGIYSNLGENQIKEIVSSSKFSIFFVDEDQKVTLSDIGDIEEITKWADSLGASTTEMELASQFRCNGSDGYIAWLDNILQIRDTANTSLTELDYEYSFDVFESPGILHEYIKQKNELNNKSRIVAGYCWKWVSKKNPELFDIEIGEYKARWNLDKHGQAWIIQPNSVSEVGCIHTCQGLELDYVGVIIGPDMIVRGGKIITDATKRASSDRSVSGYKKLLKEGPDTALALGDMIVKNTYRTLMTRGMKGCFVYSTDPETQEYFRNALTKSVDRNIFDTDNLSEGLVA